MISAVDRVTAPADFPVNCPLLSELKEMPNFFQRFVKIKLYFFFPLKHKDLLNSIHRLFELSVGQVKNL